MLYLTGLAISRECDVGMAEQFPSYLKEMVYVESFGSSGACLSHVIWLFWLPRPCGYFCYSGKGGMDGQHSLAHLLLSKVFSRGVFETLATRIPF